MEKGFSLLEYLLVSFMTSVLLLGLLQFYLRFWEQHRYQQAILLRYEHVQAAGHFVRESVQGAGYVACASRVLTEGKGGWQSVSGYGAVGEGWQPVLPEALRGKVKPGSDVIALAQMRFQHSEILAIGAEEFIVRGQYFKMGDQVVIANCVAAELMTIASAQATSGNQRIRLTQSLQHQYAMGSAVGHWQETTLYIRDTHRKDPRGNPIYALYQMQGGQTEELIAGIENLSIQYGITTTQDVQFYSADAVSDWSSVSGLKLLITGSTLLNTQAHHDQNSQLAQPFVLLVNRQNGRFYG